MPWSGEYKINRRLAQELKAIREDKGLTQVDLTHLTGYSQSWISHIENRYREPSEDFIERFIMAVRPSLDQAEELLKLRGMRTWMAKKLLDVEKEGLRFEELPITVQTYSGGPRFGPLLSKLRKSKLQSREELTDCLQAEGFNIDQYDVTLYEEGKGVPSLSILLSMSACLELDEEEIDRLEIAYCFDRTIPALNFQIYMGRK